MDADALVAAGGVISIVGALFVAWRTASSAARKDEVALLREEVTRLQKRVDLMEVDVQKEQRNKSRLQDYIATLRTILIQAGMALPEIPKLE
jgi:hypothetical protein